MSSASALVGETLASSGVDAVLVDMQHGEATLDDVFALMAAIELRGAEPFVRVPSLDAGILGRVLDMGATGVIVPMVDSPREAEAFVGAVRYPPRGGRSYGPRRPILRYGPRYLDAADQTVVAIAMIETEAGLANATAIAATDGLDGLFVGPADLVLALGGRPGGPEDVVVSEAVQAIREAASQTGLHAGIFCSSAADALSRLRQGFDFVTFGSDLAMLEREAHSSLALVV